MDPNDQLGLAGPLNIELKPVDKSQSEMDISESSALNMTVVSMPTDRQSTTDNTTAIEQEDDQNGDDESEDETFSRLDNRTYQCKFCPEIFRTLQVIRKHTKVQHPSVWKSFKCVHCQRRFLTEQMRDHHVRFHSLDHPFKCTECDQMYRSKNNRDKHFQAFHDRNSHHFSMERFHCGSCELTFVEKRYYHFHSTIYHDTKPRRLKNLFGKIQVCERCVKTFDSRDLLMEHIRETHKGDPPCKNGICKMCSKDLKTVTLLRTHILVVHFGMKPFDCQHCNAEFSSRRLLLKHMEKDHSEVISFKCPSCDESFATEYRMTRHQAMVHFQLEIEYDPQIGKTVYPCGKCEKKFESKNLLDKHLEEAHPSFTLMYKCPLCPQSVRCRKQHMRVHHGVEYDAKEHHDLVHYKCHCCSKLFQEKHNLLAHQNEASMQCGRCRKIFKTEKNYQAHMSTHPKNKTLKCEDCGLDFSSRSRLEEHRMRYHSPTSTQVLKIINCPYCPKLFTSQSNRSRHITIHHAQNEFQVNCGHCPMQVTDTVLLRKHYKAVHPGNRVTFKCPECATFFLRLSYFKDHCKRHRQEAEAQDKGELNCTSESVDDGVKASGQTNDQTADAEFELMVIKEEAIVQGDPVEDGLNENDQNSEGELVSIVIKEEAIVQSGKAAVSGISAAAGIKDSSFNTKESSEQGVIFEIKQEPLDNGEAATSTDFIVWEKSTAAGGTSEQKSSVIEEQQLNFVEANKVYQEPKREPSVQDQVISIESIAEELQQEEQMEVDETIEQFAAETPPRRGHKARNKCQDCGWNFGYRRRFEEHRKRFHSPTSTQVLKIFNCPYCPKLFISPMTRTRHIGNKHVPSEFKVNCAHCPVQMTDTVLLRKHYKTVHPGERVVFKCPGCEKVYLDRSYFKHHYKKHRKEAGVDEKAAVNSTSEPIEDGVKKTNQNADGELESIVVKEEPIVQIGNAAAPDVNVSTGIRHYSLEINESSEQGVKNEIKQEPLDNC